MEQIYLCAYCSEENEIQMETGDGDRQTLYALCEECGQTNRIMAQFNFHTSEFDLAVDREGSD